MARYVTFFLVPLLAALWLILGACTSMTLDTQVSWCDDGEPATVAMGINDPLDGFDGGCLPPPAA